MICPKCNEDIILKDVYCSLCGFKIFHKESRQRFFFGEIYTDTERDTIGKIPGKHWLPLIKGLTGGKSILVPKIYLFVYSLIFFLIPIMAINWFIKLIR
jgi:DNA-directed RNA polymerase subunit RPC12/RpoP